MNNGSKWKVVVVDQDPAARRTLSALLLQYAQVEVVSECASAEEASDAIRMLNPDVIVVDVQMPSASALETVRALTAPIVVFTTSHAEHALMSVLDHPSDFLLKPVSAERMSVAMANVLWALEHAHDVSMSRAPRVLTIKEGGKTTVLPATEIDWLEADGYCTRIHAGRQKILVRRSLPTLLDDLQPDGFMRAHRTSIVNLARVREIRSIPSGDAEAVLTTGSILLVSRSHRMLLENQLQMRRRR